MWILPHCRDLCGLPSAPSVSQGCVHLTLSSPRFTVCTVGLCAPVPASQAPTLHRRGACVHVSQLPGLVSASWALCALVSSHCLCSLSPGLFVPLAVPQESCVRCPSLYASPLSAPQSCPLSWLCSSAGYLGLPSVLQGSCVLAGFLCPITLSYLGPPSALQGLCVLAGFVGRTTLGSPNLPSVWGHSP